MHRICKTLARVALGATLVLQNPGCTGLERTVSQTNVNNTFRDFVKYREPFGIYEIDYPYSWTRTERIENNKSDKWGEGENKIVQLMSPVIGFGDYFCENVQINSRKKNENTIKEAFDFLRAECEKFVRVDSFERFSRDGVECARLFYSTNMYGRSFRVRQTFYLGKEYAILSTMVSTSADFDSFNELFNRIESSLKIKR